MTEEQHEHLNKLRGSFILRLEQKYSAGQQEHGGNLWDKNPLWMIDQEIDEAIDGYVYAKTSKDQMKEFIELVASGSMKAVSIARTWVEEYNNTGLE